MKSLSANWNQSVVGSGLIAFGLLFAAACPAAEVSSDDAVRAVGNWLSRSGVRHDYRIGGVRTFAESGGRGRFHVVDLKKGGFVITSGDTKIRPILAESDEGSFSGDPASPLYSILMMDTGAAEEETTSGLQTKMAKTASAKLHDFVLASSFVKTKWDQTTHNGDNEEGWVVPYVHTKHAACGCVATAGGQILKHFNYPGGLSLGKMTLEPANCGGDPCYKAIGYLMKKIGHCVLADGVRLKNGTFQFHINMGWGGHDNVWCTPPSIGKYNAINGVGVNIDKSEKTALLAVLLEAPSLSISHPERSAHAMESVYEAQMAYDTKYGKVKVPIHVTTDDTLPTASSPACTGSLVLDKTTHVRAVCVQPGRDVSQEISGLYLERHPVVPGEWTTDVDGVREAGLTDGNLIVVMRSGFTTCYWSQQLRPVVESPEFLSWARQNGVYLVRCDMSQDVDYSPVSSWSFTLYCDAGYTSGVKSLTNALARFFRERPQDVRNGRVTAETIVPYQDVTYYAHWREIPVLKPGTVCLAEPYPLEAKAGTTVRFRFSRVDGCDGSIAVKVKTQTSSRSSSRRRSTFRS